MNLFEFVSFYIGSHLVLFLIFKYYHCAIYLKTNANNALIKTKHKEFAREDMDQWTILKCFPYMLSYLPRFIIGWCIAALGAVMARIALIGVDDVKNSNALRVRLMRKYLNFCLFIAITSGYGYTKFNCVFEVGADYSDYLGPDWEPEWSGASTIVANHASYVDSFFIMWKY